MLCKMDAGNQTKTITYISEKSMHTVVKLQAVATKKTIGRGYRKKLQTWN